MLYRVIGIMSGSSLDGMDLVFTEIEETGGKWSYNIRAAACYPYEEEWKLRLSQAVKLPASEYMLLHSDFGHYTGAMVNRFIAENQLEYQVGLIASHGHTTFHMPPRMTAQLGDGAAIAAETALPVISDLRALDLANGGQGAPIVPIGEKLLLGNYPLFLNIGGIANISQNNGSDYIAFDICPANRVLNLIAAELGKEYDDGGNLASIGTVHGELLEKLNSFGYYSKAYPKSLANDFGTDEVYPLIESCRLRPEDALATYVEHISVQISRAVQNLPAFEKNSAEAFSAMLVTGGGAFNDFLLKRINELLEPFQVKANPADPQLAMYKAALIMALLGVLRRRDEPTTITSVTGARKASIGGAMWMGQGAG